MGQAALGAGMSLVLDTLSAAFGSQRLFEKLSVVIAAGEIVTVMGPSGSGKTTLLSIVAGDMIDTLTAGGHVFLNNRDLAGLAPERRRIGRLFQDDLLFPHLTVGENLLFGVARGPRSERLLLMEDALERLELQGFKDRAPHTLSGGQRARVSLMRALLAKPDAMLLDEPFGKLDKTLRATIRDHTFGRLRAQHIPTLLVTHDLEDVPPGGKVIHV